MDLYILKTENGVQYAYEQFDVEHGFHRSGKRIEYNGQDPLPDDEYPKELFRDIIPAAHIIPEGEPTPVTPQPYWVEYIGGKDDDQVNS